MNNDVLVLFSYKNHKRGYIEMLFSRLVATSKSYNLNLFRSSLSDMHIEIKNNQLLVFDPINSRDLASYGLIYFELWYKAQQQALALATFAKRHKMSYFSKELAGILPITKIGELSVLADNNLPLPQTFISSNSQIKKIFKINPPFKYPFVLKAADGYGGNNNYLINTYNQLVKILGQNKKINFLAQEFIPNNNDYRCLVFGGKIKLILKRTRIGDTHLNNTSKGAEATLVDIKELSETAIEDIIKSAKLLKRDQFCGVDLVIDSESGKHYILEVNQTPQIEIGAEIDSKISAMLKYISEQVEANK